MAEKLSRRAFSQTGAATVLGLTALQASRVLGANERIRLGFIGIGGRGKQVASAFSQHADAEIVALCDVSRSTVEEANARLTEGKAGNLRRLPQAAGPERYRRRSHRHARPLARHPNHHGLPGREGRLLREAAVEDDPRRATHGQHGKGDQTCCSSRHTPP